MSGAAIAKAAAAAVKHKDKIWKAAGIITVAILFPATILVASFLSLVSSFLPDGAVMDSNTYEITETAIYKEIKPIMDAYMEEAKEQIEERKEQLIEEHTEEKTETDGNGNEIKVKKCDLTVHKNYGRSITPYLVAYLQCTGKLEEKTGKIDKDAATSFLQETSRIKVKKVAEKEYDIFNTHLNPKRIAKKYFEGDTERSRFLASSSAYQSFFGKEEIEVDTETININEMQNVNASFLEMPLYLQYSGPWATTPYGNGYINGYGCCPTCLAMVLSYMKQQVILPNHIVAWTGNRYYVPGHGSAWSIFPAVAQQWGVTCTDLGNNPQAMVAALQAGKPVIASMRPGTFTRGGHFIVLTGITSNFGIRVNDPNDNATKNFKNREFELSLIIRESKNYWSFE
jgi:hypothetical protein